MTLPQDPYEVTTEQPIEADQAGIEQLEAVCQKAVELIVQLQARLNAGSLAYVLTATGPASSG